MAEYIYEAVLLNRYYDERARSSTKPIPDFRLDRIVWSTQGVNITNLDRNLKELEDVQLTNSGVFTYINGAIFIKASFPSDKAPLEGIGIATLGILDAKGGLCCVLSVAPSITAKRGRMIDITFKISTGTA
ncbi:hypothetical protein VXS06_14355 [Photobacterium toruni]|uniref:Uncharacterized protein n=1 Tax=Photobacterium toruni TaxID=1935446 RepID=A0ABU6L9V9_9GAMM|nr:hypothetical protein [Photobacterium toruni]